MPDISLLQPEVIRDVVSKIQPPESLILTNRITKSTTPFPVVSWEVERGSRTMAQPNVPNSEAHIVPRQGIASESASLVYLREKKVFKPTTLHWLKAAGSATATRNAETEVLKEVKDLNLRFDNFWEWSLWQAVQGSLVLDSPDVQANVNYHLPASHKPVAAEPWSTALPTDIVANIRAWQKLVLRDGMVTAKEAFATGDTLNLIVEAFTKNQINLMSDRMRDEYFSTGTLRGFMNMTWTVVDTVYDVKQSDGTFLPVGFLPEGVLVFGDLKTNTPIEMVQGPSADDEAPENFTGRFAKTWKEKDPSARQYLIEENALPIITRPEQWVVADVATGA